MVLLNYSLELDTVTPQMSVSEDALQLNSSLTRLNGQLNNTFIVTLTFPMRSVWKRDSLCPMWSNMGSMSFECVMEILYSIAAYITRPGYPAL